MSKQLIDYDTFVEMSTDLAEEEHHKTCDYECCGEHNEFQEFEKCPKCGMTEAIQEDHNNDWWSAVDEVEANLLEKYEIEDDPMKDIHDSLKEE